MRILVVTDAWYPQVNGVVRTLDTVARELGGMGHEMAFITPNAFFNVPCPTYPEIRLAFVPAGRLSRLIRDFDPDTLHISTEGPLGWAARRYCRRRGLPFTTAFHTRFPEYLQARVRVPLNLTYAWIRRFHAPAARMMVATETLRQELAARGFGEIALWGRGVDLDLFRPRERSASADERPILLYVGRIAVEKSVEDFVRLDVPGTKVVVGDGPDLQRLKALYPETRFTGAKSGEELAGCYADADAFVFPSRTDTFGNVLLEALASGVPVAAYPAQGPRDVIDGHPVGCLDDDLARAIRGALDLDRTACRKFAARHSWRASAEEFLANLEPWPR